MRGSVRKEGRCGSGCIGRVIKEDVLRGCEEVRSCEGMR